MSTHLTVATRAAKIAGSLLKRSHGAFSRSDVKAKAGNSSVTSLDKASEKLILRELKRHFPDHSYIAEEAGASYRPKSRYAWMVDPLDGTSNYIMGNPIYGVSIGLAINNVPALGICYFPELGRFISAETGKGARLNGRKIKVSAVSNFRRATHTVCHGQRPQDIKKILAIYGRFLPKHIRIRHLGSAALEQAQVAMGMTDSYVSIGISPWDIAAGVCIVREAGGKVTDGNGKKWSFTSPMMIASNGKVHDELVRFINR